QQQNSPIMNWCQYFSIPWRPPQTSFTLVATASAQHAPDSIFSRSRRSQTNDRFHVMSLREHIKCSDRVKKIITREQTFKIARKRCRVARDVRDRSRSKR